jgi:methylated-DNA-[protein]-cysteine S-methyltransferase
MKLYQYVMDSVVGPLYLIASEHGLVSLWIGKPSEEAAATTVTTLQSAEPAVRILAAATAQLQEYLQGLRKKFELPLDVSGTEFQKRVWSELTRIPYGETRSYKDVSIRVQNEKATRAVGTANGKNPLPIIVPCHRVIASDGGLGGYSGGLHVKEALLNLERKHSSV